VSELCDAELRRIIEAFGHAGIRLLVIKGAALAYTHYRVPHLRPRNDSDVVIEEAQCDAAAGVLSALGYVKSHAIDGTLITQQSQWTRALHAGLSHALDVHWRVFNPHLFANVSSVESLMARAVPVPALGAHALAPRNVDALVLACAHRVAHHPGADDAVWDYDIHLLVSSLRDNEIGAFTSAVAAADLRAVTAACIAAARARFGTRVPTVLQSFLDRAREHSEPTAVFLDAGRRQVDILVSDLGALGGWRARALLLRQHVFPPSEYVFEKYGRRSRAWLPWLYARRVVSGMPRWLRSQRS
jgi:hypothetical protein